MKCYEYGFTAESGEFFSIGESGYDGRTLIAIAESEAAAEQMFLAHIDDEYITEESHVREVQNADPFDESRYICIGMDTE